MKTKQTIAVIGATGKVGSALSKSLSAGGYRVLLCATDEGKLGTLSTVIRDTDSKADVDIVICPVNASWEADVIILAIPHTAEAGVAESIKPVSNQKVVISISSPFDTSANAVLTTDSSAAEQLQQQLPNTKVVKAFHTAFAADLVTQAVAGQPVDVLLAANSAEAIGITATLVEAIGFHAVPVGDLQAARMLEYDAVHGTRVNLNV